MPEIERPPGRVRALPDGPFPNNADSPPAQKLTTRAERLCKLKKGNAISAGWMARHAKETSSPGEVRHAAARMDSCGLALLLRQYVETGNVQLAEAHFCNLHLLCSLCAAGRSHKLITRFRPAVFSANLRRQSYSLTLTLPSGPDLVERLEVLCAAVRKLWMRKKRKGNGPFRNVLGLICSIEITRSEKGWHPHMHCIATLDRPHRIDANELRAAWDPLTGGGRQLKLIHLKSDSDLLEVFKYALKPGELFPPKSSPETRKNGLWMPDRVEAWLLTRNRRFLRSYGIYRGLDPEPDSFLDQDELGSFVEFALFWMQSLETYYITKREGRHDLHPVQELPRLGKIEAAL